MTWQADGPQGNEAAKIKNLIVPFTRGRVLDLGCGPYKCWPHFIGVDNGHHAREFGWQYKPDVHVEDSARLDVFRDESMDAVFSSHLLEHIEDYRGALREWWSVIKPGGHLVLYLPHKDFYPNIGQPGANPDHKHDFRPNDVVEALAEASQGLDLLVKEDRNEGDEYSFLLVFKKNEAGDYEIRRSCDLAPKKTALVCRFGGFGDLLMASSVLPGLKRQGYWVQMMTTPKGEDLLREDPHIDAWWIQDTDQVPNAELPAYWEQVGSRFDRFVNLSESVEGTLLAVPGRSNHTWPDEVRRRRLGTVNYLDFIHDLAEVPRGPKVRFYSTDAELKWARDVRDGIGGDSFIVVWSLAGSSLHKAYPWTDPVVARLMMECPRAKVIFVGDTACQILEMGWEAETRVVRRSGVWTIRESLAFLQFADCVVGPETGVLNAAGGLKVPKVIMLSHSSRENLTRDWKRTTVLTPQGLPCYPCHRIHYGDRYCHVEPESRAALCAFTIEPGRVFDAIRNYYQEIIKS